MSKAYLLVICLLAVSFTGCMSGSDDDTELPSLVDDETKQEDDTKEQVELENMRKEEVSETFWKVNISDMPPVFIEAGSSSEIKKDMRKKLKPDVFKELAVERVTKSEMIKKYREMVKGDSGEDEPKEEKTTISKMYGHVKTLMKVN